MARRGISVRFSFPDAFQINWFLSLVQIASIANIDWIAVVPTDFTLRKPDTRLLPALYGPSNGINLLCSAIYLHPGSKELRGNSRTKWTLQGIVDDRKLRRKKFHVRRSLFNDRAQRECDDMIKSRLSVENIRRHNEQIKGTWKSFLDCRVKR